MNIIPLIKKDFKLFFKTRSAVALTYIVPMVITLIFGAVFGGFGKSEGISGIKILLVDDDQTKMSRKFHTLLDSLSTLQVYTKHKHEDEIILFNQEIMDDWIKEGKRKLGIYIPKGFEKNIMSSRKVSLEIHFDPKYQIEYGITYGITKKVMMENFPQLMISSMMKSPIFRQFSFAEAQNPLLSSLPDNSLKMEDPIDLKPVQLLGKAKENSMFAQYVAGMAVLFLLFSVTYAGASLIDEKNNGTINRLLIAPVKRSEILVSKMLYISLLGLSQLIVLFVFGWLVFNLNIFKDVPALLIMIVVTALACSSVGIFIASICRNQQQVGSLSTLIVLGMSALGGSMFPSFIMPKYIQTIGKFTLNHWAMKGITDIFWYSRSLSDIYSSILVLLGITVVFSYIAIRIFNKRLME